MTIKTQQTYRNLRYKYFFITQKKMCNRTYNSLSQSKTWVNEWVKEAKTTCGHQIDILSSVLTLYLPYPTILSSSGTQVYLLHSTYFLRDDLMSRLHRFLFLLLDSRGPLRFPTGPWTISTPDIDIFIKIDSAYSPP